MQATERNTMRLTTRQTTWREASDKAVTDGEDLAAGFFALLSLPTAREGRQHSCAEHARGFRRNGRRGLRCGICRDIVRWIDEV